MSSGKSLTTRQRRGASVRPIQYIPFPPLIVTNDDQPTGLLEFTFDTDVVASTDPTDWTDVFIIDGGGHTITSVTQPSPRVVQLHFAGGFGAGERVQNTGGKSPVLSLLGAIMPAFSFVAATNEVWPPLPL